MNIQRHFYIVDSLPSLQLKLSRLLQIAGYEVQLSATQLARICNACLLQLVNENIYNVKDTHALQMRASELPIDKSDYSKQALQITKADIYKPLNFMQ